MFDQRCNEDGVARLQVPVRKIDDRCGFQLLDAERVSPKPAHRQLCVVRESLAH